MRDLMAQRNKQVGKKRHVLRSSNIKLNAPLDYEISGTMLNVYLYNENTTKRLNINQSAGVLPRGREAELGGRRENLGSMQDQAEESQVAVPIHQGMQVT